MADVRGCCWIGGRHNTKLNFYFKSFTCCWKVFTRSPRATRLSHQEDSVSFALFQNQNRFYCHVSLHISGGDVKSVWKGTKAECSTKWTASLQTWQSWQDHPMTASSSDIVQHITSPLALHATLLSQVWRIIFVSTDTEDIRLSTPQIPEEATLCCECVSPCTCRGQSSHSSLSPPEQHPPVSSGTTPSPRLTPPQLRKPEEKALIGFLISASRLQQNHHRYIQTESSLHSHLTHLSHRNRLFQCSDVSIRSVWRSRTQDRSFWTGLNLLCFGYKEILSD